MGIAVKGPVEAGDTSAELDFPEIQVRVQLHREAVGPGIGPALFGKDPEILRGVDGKYLPRFFGSEGRQAACADQQQQRRD